METNSDGLVNLLHYEDAAAATIAALLATGAFCSAKNNKFSFTFSYEKTKGREST